MRRSNLAARIVAVSYLAWGAVMVGLCVRESVGEECISGMWMLVLTGLPISVVGALAFGRPGPLSLIVLTALGALQWSLIARAVVARWERRAGA